MTVPEGAPTPLPETAAVSEMGWVSITVGVAVVASDAVAWATSVDSLGALHGLVAAGWTASPL